MRAMGELLLANTNFKTFADFATAYLGPWAGFFLGWSYWCNWIITAIADVIVIGGYMQFWYRFTRLDSSIYIISDLDHTQFCGRSIVR